MSTSILQEALQWLNPKRQQKYPISAAFHMISITLISMSMVQLDWFNITGNVCVPFLTLSQFFWFGYSAEDLQNPAYECLTSTITNLMRIIILLCFTALIFSLMGFLLDVTGAKNNFIQQYSLASTFTVFWTIAILCVSYYTSVLLENELSKLYYKKHTRVSYGNGFYLIAITSGISIMGTICRVLTDHAIDYNNDDRCLFDGYEDNVETFSYPVPPPPYNMPQSQLPTLNIPPPPYTP